jgi:hypothetical protein
MMTMTTQSAATPAVTPAVTPAITNPRPWYRQFWPWFIMGLPAAAVIASFTSLYFAVVNEDSLVRDDWYQDGKAANKDLRRYQVAKQAGMNADLRFDAITGEVMVDVNANDKNITLPDTLELMLSHTTLAERDQTLTLHHQKNGHYLGTLEREPQGKFSVELGNAQWRISNAYLLPRESLHLEPN